MFETRVWVQIQIVEKTKHIRMSRSFGEVGRNFKSTVKSTGNNEQSDHEMLIKVMKKDILYMECIMLFSYNNRRGGMYRKC